jgi:RNA recognition motif-containing protein
MLQLNGGHDRDVIPSRVTGNSAPKPPEPSITSQKGNAMNIYVGNLSFKTTEKGLKETFEAFGTVKSARIITDGYTGKSKGFGFVEMPDTAEAKAAIAGMNGKELDLSPLKVNEAKPRDVRPERSTAVH